MIRPSLIVPNSLLVCDGYPIEPDLEDPDFDRKLALFIRDTYHAWDDCRGNLEAVADLLEEQG